MATRAVAEHLKVTKKAIAFGLSTGGYLVLRAEVLESLPAEFAEGEAV